MKKIIAVLLMLISLLFAATCERYDMYDMAVNGLPPRAAIYMYSIGTHTGDLDGRNSADQLCYTDGFAYTKYISAGKVKAFLSFSSMDELRFIVPVQYWVYPVVGIAPTMAETPVANSWADLMNNLTINPINTSVGLGSIWWSGSASGGTASLMTCSDWHDGTPSSSGMLGSTGIDTGGSTTCDIMYPILCIAY
jgi:hypothetical protein